MDNRCVCCGEIIPEGRQVCPNCEHRAKKPKMSFNRSPEWGSRFQFPENMSFEYDGQKHTLVNEIVVKMAEKYDNFIVDQIAMEARASGVSDLTVLNKAAILDALQKRTPRKPIHESLADRACPSCYGYIPFDALNDDITDAPNFCKHCGQALDWRVNDA